ncbi:MAG: putative glycolipid-binding domain-containing protein [Deltaproteobacteria bacterium]|nr:putative glycolipid-binding domain-containing protein [Deltaproteobacteria bacterium]
MSVGSILWKRLDRPGHDACIINRIDNAWNLCGSAVFQHDGQPAQLSYEVVCDAAWRTLHGQVKGWLGERQVFFRLARKETHGWRLNDQEAPHLQECVDLDLGFTPATNILPVRRLRLAEGQAANAPAAWLDVSTGALTFLPQRYERRSKTTYWYEAPTANYADLLIVDHVGFVVRYPGLWEIVR